MRRLRDALQNERSETTLDVAALELARVEFPGLDFESSLFRLANLAEQVGARLKANSTGLEFIQVTNDLLFDTLQFRGNEGDFYDPRNSCLNSVLTRRLGIPISLSIVYIEVARRLSKPVYGVGLPGHFIVAYEDPGNRYWVDPFHSGRILSFAECCALAKETAGVDLRANPAVLAPVTKRQILVRMLSNLKAIYLRGQALNKAKQVLDLLIEAMPAYAEEYRHRGLIHLRQLNHRAAKADLETYLRLETDAPEREQVEKQLLLIERWKAGLN
ncbi:MAG TPA: transglutaminase-like domain-containing protein [Bryobacteraceae bacterium]|nr:transglutaminase-like domain-containing protein [Bryobacteraceae bacterium]